MDDSLKKLPGKVYLVGGAVRDKLLGLPVKDRDWLVTGVTEAELVSAGFQKVGKHFPVYLHPGSHEEYALPRRSPEACPLAGVPDSALYADLSARDLTINAMAIDSDGQLIDPFDGERDLQRRLLRHVSSAFADDPVRILRTARLHARYAHRGFRIAGESLRVMGELSSELKTVATERLWQEISLALTEPRPSIFFQDLRECGALEVILPELDALFGIPQPPKYHPEIDTGVHTLLVVDRARQLSEEAIVTFAALTHDLGKALSPKNSLPHHYGHESRGRPLVNAVCQRLRVPNDWRKLALNVCVYHTHCHRATELKPKTILKTLYGLDAFRQPESLERFVLACQADARGRTGFEDRPYPQADVFRNALKAAQEVQTRPLLEAGYEGEKLRQKLDRARVKAIKAV